MLLAEPVQAYLVAWKQVFMAKAVRIFPSELVVSPVVEAFWCGDMAWWYSCPRWSKAWYRIVQYVCKTAHLS